jgi:hypothetical protein
MHLRRSLLAGGSILAAAAALTLGGASAASAGTHRSAASQAAAARAALRGLTVPGTVHRYSPAGEQIRGLKQVEASNWSGYADTGTGYSKVSSSWTEPSVTCGTSRSYAAFWVGIDGYSSNSVEQGGTLAECYKDRAYYMTWWEHYPTNAIQSVGYTVAPGDKITASVVRSGTTYTVSVTDATHPANSFSHTFTCSSSSCADTSAEWIAEAPSGSNGVLPLAHFSKWTTSGAAVATTSKSGSISSFPDFEITMVGAHDTKATPSALNSAGTSFSVTWDHSS